MRRCVVLAAVCLSVAFAQAPVPVEREPRHRTVFADAGMRVLDVTIPYGDTTLEHTHRFDLATVCVECAATRARGPGEDWGPVRSRALGSVQVTEYAGKGGTHAVTTVAQGRYRLIAVENLRASGWSTTPPVAGPGMAVSQETRAFRIYEVTPPAGAPASHTHATPVVVVNPASGEWTVVPGGRAHATGAARGAGSRMVEIELR
jgi:hypothetical protein